MTPKDKQFVVVSSKILLFWNATYFPEYITVASILVDKAVENAYQAIFSNMGQVCNAGSRTYVHQDVYDEFAKRSVERAKKQVIGDPDWIWTSGKFVQHIYKFNAIKRIF